MVDEDDMPLIAPNQKKKKKKKKTSTESSLLSGSFQTKFSHDGSIPGGAALLFFFLSFFSFFFIRKPNRSILAGNSRYFCTQACLKECREEADLGSGERVLILDRELFFWPYSCLVRIE